MFYVYILQSIDHPARFYTGFSSNIENRLKAHNMGQDTYTRKYKPWKLKTLISFTDRERALDFERYLKTPSGRGFVKKRL
ncbi:MAG: GIY-YIG nuclease family protein [Candidatus Marinimicrobia bacterium]|jgi:predicted GIY-YIG superfamily endonuclease|nr:GIY-YIG nuclease family protein [Candidatus Neomarinimicrobiota bacterium]MBT3630896.1 GIY-YIG nuclease family protein [Candidatus Neomarinimicrobiota bacterium]MBT3826168.1 GIY-YIG nuclease family protein [Candidatus Neomarinimicrobiota bacterium]MBT4130884.1 GIY-YIG nuclease family protein [Candidatus Neomarinimicrobiota bacterium]MBT4295677.1 GIY-YIG nuclease family protein [Candidatus Neomarinimicrobiota bacterium]